MTRYIQNYLNLESDAAPLSYYRLAFGAMMFISILRFYFNGWIEKLYLEPTFFFSYFGFEWVQPLGGWTYFIFVICALSALFIAIGFKYRISAVMFFLSFTYIELMDKTTYLNHYYFISLMAFLLIFLPANQWFSVDAYHNNSQRYNRIPKWTLDTLKLMICIMQVWQN